MKEKCQVCGQVDEDIRHVGVECFYAVDEVVPEAEEQLVLQRSGKRFPWGYTIVCCKDCRADFLGVLKRWKDSKGNHETFDAV